MKFFKNKHVIMAMIVAPVLAIASYYLVDQWVKEQPKAAVAGGSYPLVAESNCRFSSGACELSNADFRSTIRVEQVGDQQRLRLTSNHPLQGAKIGFVTSDGAETAPVSMTAATTDKKSWSIAFSVAATDETLLRVALRANDAHYFAETTLGFSQYQTSFDKDFRKNTP